MLFRHLHHLVDYGIAAVLARLEREIAPGALRDLGGASFKGISIYRADPSGASRGELSGVQGDRRPRRSRVAAKSLTPA